MYSCPKTVKMRRSTADANARDLLCENHNRVAHNERSPIVGETSAASSSKQAISLQASSGRDRTKCRGEWFSRLAAARERRSDTYEIERYPVYTRQRSVH